MLAKENDIVEAAKERIRIKVFFFIGFLFGAYNDARFCPEIVREMSIKKTEEHA